MPTFKFFKNGKEVDMIRGANESKLREKMQHFQEGTWDPSMSTTSHQHGTNPTQIIITLLIILYFFWNLYSKFYK